MKSCFRFQPSLKRFFQSDLRTFLKEVKTFKPENLPFFLNAAKEHRSADLYSKLLFRFQTARDYKTTLLIFENMKVNQIELNEKA